jgi:hypothetical protein
VGADRPRRSTGGPHPDACLRTDGRHDVMSATAQRSLPLHRLAPGLTLARGGPGRSLNVYLLGDVIP